MNTPVSSPIAKLLKEKGFKSKSAAFYDGVGELFHYTHSNNAMQRFRYGAPTIAEVVMWCFNKHSYSIEYSMNIPESGEYDGCYVFNGLIKGSEDYKLKIFYTSKDYPTIEKALEDTINYFLVNFC